MPRKPKEPTINEAIAAKAAQGIYWLPNDAPWGGFINVNVNDSEKEAFGFWVVENERDVPAMLDDLLAEGMKYGVSYDRENECFIVTLTGGLVEKANLRCCVTSRSGTHGEAVALAIWKHYILCAGNYGDLLATGRKRSWG